jgi:hypothetical protein
MKKKWPEVTTKPLGVKDLALLDSKRDIFIRFSLVGLEC